MPMPAGDDGSSLPPFLRQGTGAADKAPHLPGTSLFASAAKGAPRPEQPAPQGEGDVTQTVTVPTLPTEGTAAPDQAGSSATEQATAELVGIAAAGGPARDGTGSEAPAGTPETALAPGTETAAAALPPISIKGRSDGLVIEIGKGSWSEILASLDDRLEQSASFFRNARVAVDLGTRATTEAELTPLVDLLKTHSLTLGSVRTSTERTFQAALALGLTTTLESAEGVPVADAAPATSNTTVGAYFVYRGYLRSGHRLQRSENILVIGDVNPGAEVSSDGDVLVWGRLRGVVHAGAKGNLRAIVAALDLEPTQLRIADVMTIGPDPRPGQPGKWFWKRSATKRPEIARIANETISIEEWDATRPGGIVSLRRGG
jgi:septum site-determining protein MinC